MRAKAKPGSRSWRTGGDQNQGKGWVGGWLVRRGDDGVPGLAGWLSGCLAVWLFSTLLFYFIFCELSRRLDSGLRLRIGDAGLLRVGGGAICCTKASESESESESDSMNRKFTCAVPQMTDDRAAWFGVMLFERVLLIFIRRCRLWHRYDWGIGIGMDGWMDGQTDRQTDRQTDTDRKSRWADSFPTSWCRIGEGR